MALGATFALGCPSLGKAGPFRPSSAQWAGLGNFPSCTSRIWQRYAPLSLHPSAVLQPQVGTNHFRPTPLASVSSAGRSSAAAGRGTPSKGEMHAPAYAQLGFLAIRAGLHRTWFPPGLAPLQPRLFNPNPSAAARDFRSFAFLFIGWSQHWRVIRTGR